MCKVKKISQYLKKYAGFDEKRMGISIISDIKATRFP